MIDLRALSLFVGVAERLNLSQAAKAFHISQSALSRQIQTLERGLDITLFDRAGKRLLLTAEGEDLLPRAQALLDQA
ncbi:MAG: LysR family transcriptional regulator, partial [Paraburkholderia sp.]